MRWVVHQFSATVSPLDRSFAISSLPLDLSLFSEELRPAFSLPLEVAELALAAFARMAGDESLKTSVSIGYSADTRFDACAHSSDGRHHVVVSAAVPALLLSLFFDIVNSTHPFSSDPGTDEIQPSDFRMPLSLHPTGAGGQDLVETIESVVREAMPQHRWQRILAVVLAELATVFIFAHELGHVVYGHTTLLSSERGLALRERRFDGDGPPRRISQAWELQADQAAFSFLWSYAINTKRQRRRLLKHLLCKSSSDLVLELFGRLCYVMSFVFFLLGQGRVEVVANGSHPSPLVRITFLIALAESIMEDVYPQSAALAHEVAVRAHESAESVWNRLGLEFGKDGFRDRIDDLPTAINRTQCYLSKVQRRFGRYAWASALRRTRTHVAS